MTYGKSKLGTSKWNIKREPIVHLKEVKYLGVTLSGNNSCHSLERIKAGRAAFYSLQSSGLCKYGISMIAASTLFNSVIQPVLTYGMNCVFQSKQTKKSLVTTQCKFVKSVLGLRHSSKISPLLQGLKIHKVSDVIELQDLSLFRIAMLSNSRTISFYRYIWDNQVTA